MLVMKKKRPIYYSNTGLKKRVGAIMLSLIMIAHLCHTVAADLQESVMPAGGAPRRLVDTFVTSTHGNVCV